MNAVAMKGVSRAGDPKEALLKADHETVDALFAEFETARSLPEKQALLNRICTELTVHALEGAGGQPCHPAGCGRG